MRLTPQDLEKIARLASLDTEHSDKLNKDINAIMDFVDQLRSVDTDNIAPLFHPLELVQRLRPDEVTEQECLDELKAIASNFENNFYWVPKVIESD